MSVMAYCLAFHYHPKQWTMKLIDNIMDAGDQWYDLHVNALYLSMVLNSYSPLSLSLSLTIKVGVRIVETCLSPLMTDSDF